MARRLVSDSENIVFCFPKQERLKAFGAAELIEERLPVKASVVRYRNPETGLWAQAIALTGPGRDAFEEEIDTALNLARMVREEA